MDGQLCTACNTITLSMLVNGFQHPLDRDHVLKSADHCRLCDILKIAYESQTCIKHDKTQPCETDHHGPLLWRLESSGPGARWGMFKLDAHHYGDPFRLSVAEESTIFQNRIITHRDLHVANSPRNLRLLRDWLRDCHLQHEECRKGTYSGKTYDEVSTHTTLPFRVIDVGSSDGQASEHPRLFTTNDKTSGRYLTLSHCWGKVIPPRLTLKTLDTWHIRLPDEELPQTFRDAIWLTRELGERYLWIDSICIVQDDDIELGTQIGLMGEIFEGSFCTIAAVDAKGLDGLQVADSGLFVSGPERLKIARFRVEPTASGLNLGKDMTEQETPSSSEPRQSGGTADDLCEVRLQEAPKPAYPFPLRLEAKAWHSRGWVFQERELSRRCIFFTEDDVGWRCNRYWETEQTGIPERRWHRGDYNLETSTEYGGISYDPDYSLRKTWQNAVEKYSSTKLTFNIDKHKALMGFEERLTTRFGYAFYHGIVNFGQSEHLYAQLLWIPAISRGGLNTIRFPSWSWMNVKGAVKWAHSEYLVYPELLAQAQFRESRSDEAQDLQISGIYQTIKVGTRIGDIPRYSEVDRWTPDIHFGWSELDLHSDTDTILSSEDDSIIGWIAMDATYEAGTAEVLALPLMKYLRQDDEEEPMCVEFLAISETLTNHESTTLQKNETYRRVGRGRVLKNAFDWLETCQSINISII